MEQINFSENLNNKLNCNCFTTVRLKNNRKYIVGETYEIIYGKYNFTAAIVHIRHFLLKDVDNWISLIDTGLLTSQFTKVVENMYPNINFKLQQLSIILLRRKKLVKNVLDLTLNL
ncbi:MAG: hypothetical protein WC942_10500 [Clostridia bacterium]|jgi:hypothetical protein